MGMPSGARGAGEGGCDRGGLRTPWCAAGAAALQFPFGHPRCLGHPGGLAPEHVTRMWRRSGMRFRLRCGRRLQHEGCCGGMRGAVGVTFVLPAPGTNQDGGAAVAGPVHCSSQAARLVGVAGGEAAAAAAVRAAALEVVPPRADRCARSRPDPYIRLRLCPEVPRIPRPCPRSRATADGPARCRSRSADLHEQGTDTAVRIARRSPPRSAGRSGGLGGDFTAGLVRGGRGCVKAPPGTRAWAQLTRSVSSAVASWIPRVMRRRISANRGCRSASRRSGRLGGGALFQGPGKFFAVADEFAGGGRERGWCGAAQRVAS